jgi:tetratricopeptide (TPR) repeat protein
MLRVIFVLGLSLSLLASEATQLLFRSALEKIRRGEYIAAESEITEAIKESPDSFVGFDLLGIAYDGEGRSAEAEGAFTHAIELEPRYIPAHNDLGILLYRHSRLPEAVRQFLAVLTLDGHNFTANYTLGIIARDSKHYGDAVKYLETARSLAPSDPSTLLALLAAYLGAARNDDADVVSNQLVALNPTDPNLPFSVGALFLEAKHYENARKYLAQARVLSPNDYDVLYDLGQAYTHLQNYTDAENAFLKALTIHPDSADALYQLAKAYAEHHHSDEAIQILVRAKQLAPRRPDILLLLGRECIQEGLWDDAEELLVQCIALDPEKIEPHLLLGEVYTQARKYEKALIEHQQVARLDSNNPESLVALGRSYESLGRYTEARRAFEEALKRDAKNVGAAYYLGCLAEDQNDPAGAKEWFEKALRIDSGNLGSLFELGNLYTQERDYSRAQAHYERAMKTAPTFPQTYYRLSVLYRRLKDTDQANAMFALFKKYEESAEEKQKYHPHGVLTFLAQTQDLSDTERLNRYKQELLRVAQIRPDDVNALFMLAQVSFGLGERDDGLARIGQIVRLAPDDPSVRIRIANLLRAFQLNVQAVDQLRNFLEQHETAEDIRLGLATLYGSMGRTADGIDLLKPVKGVATSAACHYLLGRLLIQQGQLASALEELREATVLAPERLEYLLYAGICAAQLGRSGESARFISAAKGKGPNSAIVLYADGINLLINGRSKEAQINFQRASDLLYNWEAPWLAQAYALSDSPRQKEMLLDQTGSMFPSSPWPHLLKSKLKNSEVELDMALQFAPADPRIYAQLLPFYIERGDCEQAAEVGRRMQELGITKESPNPSCAQLASEATRPPKPRPDILLLIDMLGDPAQPM